MINYNQLRTDRYNNEGISADRQYELKQKRRAIGLEIYQTDTTIHASRQALRALLDQQPIDHDAVAEQRKHISVAHGMAQVLAGRLNTVKDEQSALCGLSVKTWR